jgi:hypothetical protein
MRKVRGKDTAPEMIVHRLGPRGRVSLSASPKRPAGEARPVFPGAPEGHLRSRLFLARPRQQTWALAEVASRVLAAEDRPPPGTQCGSRYGPCGSRLECLDRLGVPNQRPRGIIGAHRVGPKTSSLITEPSEHEANGGEVQESERLPIEIFRILGQTATAAQPG